MAICASGEKLLQEATGIRHGRVYPVARKGRLRNRKHMTSHAFARTTHVVAALHGFACVVKPAT